MIKKKETNYKTKALRKLQEISSSEVEALNVVEELISNWSTVDYDFSYSGIPVIKKEDVASESFDYFVRKVSSSYKNFLLLENSEKLSEELFGYKIPFDKQNKKVADLNSFNRGVTRLFRYQVSAFYLNGVRDNLYPKLHESLSAPESEEKQIVDSIIKLAKDNNSKDNYQKLEQFLFFRKNKSYSLNIGIYYNLINQKIKASSISIIDDNNRLYNDYQRLLTLKVETMPNGKVSPFLKVILSEDENKIKKFLVKEIQKETSKLYIKLSEKFLDLNSTTLYEFEEAVKKIDFSEIKNLYKNLLEQDRQTARSVLLELALKD